MTGAEGRVSKRQAFGLGVRIARSWRELRRGASVGAVREFLYSADGATIEQGQMDTLDVLARRPSWRMSELAEALRVEPSTVTRAVQRLERAGLARRESNDDDGRVVRVVITEHGEAVHKVVDQRRVVLISHILAYFGPDEVPVVADVMERFVQAINDFIETHERTVDGI